MLRRQALHFLGGVAAVLAALVASPVHAQTTLTFGGSDAVGSLLDRSNKRFSDLINERVGDKVKVNFISGEQLGNDIDVIQQMMQGSVQLYGDVLDWYANWVQDFNIMNWGFTFRDNDHLAAFLESDIYQQLADKLREENGIRVLSASATQPRILFAKTPIKTPDDLAGVKMRVPEIRTYLLLWETLGANPSRVAWAEVYLGLSTGTIDAAEGPVSAAFAQKFYQAVPNVMRTDHLISSYHITMNEDAFQALDEETRKVFIDTAAEVTQWAREQAEAETDGLIKQMGDAGANIVEVDKAAFQEKALSGVDQMEKDGVWSQGLWQKIQDM